MPVFERRFIYVGDYGFEWYITVPLMERLGIERYVPLIALAIYFITGDYLALLQHIYNILSHVLSIH